MPTTNGILTLDHFGRMSAKKLSPDLDFPDLSKHNNHMAKHLTREMYAKLRDVVTPSGYTFDECIQTGERN